MEIETAHAQSKVQLSPALFGRRERGLARGLGLYGVRVARCFTINDTGLGGRQQARRSLALSLATSSLSQDCDAHVTWSPSSIVGLAGGVPGERGGAGGEGAWLPSWRGPPGSGHNRELTED